MRTQYISFLFFLIMICSCGKERFVQNDTNCDLSRLTYLGDIKPIIDLNCAIGGCHDANTGTNNFDYTDYDGLKKAIGSIVNRIERNIDDTLYMPQNKQVLNICDYNRLKAWIDTGAPFK